MNIINTSAKYKITSTTKFDNLTFSDNGLILQYRKKQEIKIPFSELDKIYIKKFKLNPFVELFSISSPFILVYITIQYAPYLLLILASLFTFFPVFTGVINYKRYRLYIRLKDGNFFSKKVPIDMKSENISILEDVQREVFNYNTLGFASV